jgi:hypothetical protein
MLNFNDLVLLRFNHQRKQAKSGVRRWHDKSDSVAHSEDIRVTDSRDGRDNRDTATVATSDSKAPASEPSIRRKLLQEFHTVIKNWNEKGISTAIGRTARWQPGRNPTPTNPNPIASLASEQNLNGNAVNAQEAAKKQSNTVSP